MHANYPEYVLGIVKRAPRVARTLAAMIAVGAAPLAALGASLDLTLERAVELALANHRIIQSAEFALRGEALGLQTAQSAFELKIIPTGTLGRIGSNAFTTTTGYNSSVGVQVSRRFETGTLVSLGPSYNRFGSDRNTTLTLNLEQPLVRGWDPEVSRDPVLRAEFSLGSSRRAFEQARNNVALEAIAAYYGVLREHQLLAFAAAQRSRIEQHTVVAESKERSGLIGPMDLLRARIRLTDAEDALNQARVSSEAAMNRLRRALDLPLDAQIRLATPAEARLNGFDLEAEALARRAEIVQMRADVEEALRVAEVARKNVLPEVTLHVTAGQATQVDPFLVQYVPTTQRQWSVYLQSSTDLRRTGEKNAWRQALLRAEASRSALDTKIEEVRRQVREQRLQLADARVRIGLREEQIHQAETRLALAQVKFSHDMASNLDVIEAEGELQRAEASIAAARADYAVGVYQLRAMAGHLLDAFASRS